MSRLDYAEPACVKKSFTFYFMVPRNKKRGVPSQKWRGIYYSANFSLKLNENEEKIRPGKGGGWSGSEICLCRSASDSRNLIVFSSDIIISMVSLVGNECNVKPKYINH